MPYLSPYHFSSRPRAYHGEIRECLDVGVAGERLETVPLRSFRRFTMLNLPSDAEAEPAKIYRVARGIERGRLFRQA